MFRASRSAGQVHRLPQQAELDAFAKELVLNALLRQA
jgi:hypothetical protein